MVALLVAGEVMPCARVEAQGLLMGRMLARAVKRSAPALDANAPEAPPRPDHHLWA